MKGKEVLITGGTGSLGKELLNQLLTRGNCRPKGIRIFSRDELKQWEMRQWISNINIGSAAPGVSFLVGDIRDYDRLKMAMKGVDIVIHCAALKQVPSCEYNPIEAKKTNIDGAVNIIQAALDNDVEKVMNISTDKAVYPINLYGMTKAVAEKLFTQANVYAGNRKRPIFASCRYGNVIGSRGSIFPLFAKQIKKQGYITVTHKEMTRFFISLESVADFIIERLHHMEPGRTYIPKMPSAFILMVAEEFIKERQACGTIHSENDIYIKHSSMESCIKEIGIRPGEKLHETLITKEEGAHTIDNGTFYSITKDVQRVKALAYKSNTNSHWFSREDIKGLVVDTFA